MGAFAFALGASPGGFAVYRAWSALNGLLEHANIRLPLWLDGLLSLVTAWPSCRRSITRESRVRPIPTTATSARASTGCSPPSRRRSEARTSSTDSTASMTLPCKRPPGCWPCRSGTHTLGRRRAGAGVRTPSRRPPLGREGLPVARLRRGKLERDGRLAARDRGVGPAQGAHAGGPSVSAPALLEEIGRAHV